MNQNDMWNYELLKQDELLSYDELMNKDDDHDELKYKDVDYNACHDLQN